MYKILCFLGFHKWERAQVLYNPYFISDKELMTATDVKYIHVCKHCTKIKPV